MKLLHLHHLQFFAAPAVLVCICMLASCAGAPTLATQTFQVPVPVPCVKAAPARPIYEFDQLPATASDGDKGFIARLGAVPEIYRRTGGNHRGMPVIARACLLPYRSGES